MCLFSRALLGSGILLASTLVINAESCCIYSRLQRITWQGPYYNGLYGGSPYREQKINPERWNVSLNIPSEIWHNGTAKESTTTPSAVNIALQSALSSNFIEDDINPTTSPQSLQLLQKDLRQPTPPNSSSTKSIVTTLH